MKKNQIKSQHTSKCDCELKIKICTANGGDTVLLWSLIAIAKKKFKKFKKKISELIANYKLKFSPKMVGKLANVMSVIIKCQTNPVSYFQITGTYKHYNQKLQQENRSKKFKDHNPQKWEKLWIQNLNFTGNSWDTIYI